MDERQDELVRIDATGTAHPVGRAASREMRMRQGGLRVLPSPPHTLVMRASDQDGTRQFWMSGEITKPGVLWDLIGVSGQSNWSGELVVIDGHHAARSIFFDRGTVIGAHSTAERERIGEVLYQYGALTEEQIGTVASAVTRDVRFGEAAVALGYLTREKLFEIIGRQTAEVLYASMLVSEGTFYFIERFDESRLHYRLNLNVASLLMEGVRRMDEIELFRARIPSGLYVPAKIDGAHLAVEHEHHAVFELADGSLSLDDLGRVLGMGQFETTRAVFQLMQGGVLAVHPPRPTGVQAIVTLFNQAIALILRKVDEVGGGKDVREQLASFATASGVYDALFRDAGPARNGTLEPSKIAETVEQLVGPENAESMLSQWLYEYASFAMFIAEPLLRSRVLAASDGSPASTESAAVSKAVAELLAPLAPDS
jgi:hypothetical protein